MKKVNVYMQYGEYVISDWKIDTLPLLFEAEIDAEWYAVVEEGCGSEHLYCVADADPDAWTIGKMEEHIDEISCDFVHNTYEEECTVSLVKCHIEYDREGDYHVYEDVVRSVTKVVGGEYDYDEY